MRYRRSSARRASGGRGVHEALWKSRRGGYGRSRGARDRRRCVTRRGGLGCDLRHLDARRKGRERQRHQRVGNPLLRVHRAGSGGRRVRAAAGGRRDTHGRWRRRQRRSARCHGQPGHGRRSSERDVHCRRPQRCESRRRLGERLRHACLVVHRFGQALQRSRGRLLGHVLLERRRCHLVLRVLGSRPHRR
jgi:hypothetical protein